MVNYKGILISTAGLGIIVGSLSTVLSPTNTIMLAVGLGLFIAPIYNRLSR